MYPRIEKQIQIKGDGPHRYTCSGMPRYKTERARDSASSSMHRQDRRARQENVSHTHTNTYTHRRAGSLTPAMRRRRPPPPIVTDDRLPVNAFRSETSNGVATSLNRFSPRFLAVTPLPPVHPTTGTPALLPPDQRLPARTSPTVTNTLTHTS